MKPVPKALLIIGGLMVVGGPFSGIFCTVIGMIGAFHTLGNSGVSDPATLSGHIGQSLFATFFGLIIGMMGLPILILGAILHWTNRRPPPPPKS